MWTSGLTLSQRSKWFMRYIWIHPPGSGDRSTPAADGTGLSAFLQQRVNHREVFLRNGNSTRTWRLSADGLRYRTVGGVEIWRQTLKSPAGSGRELLTWLGFNLGHALHLCFLPFCWTDHHRPPLVLALPWLASFSHSNVFNEWTSESMQHRKGLSCRR